MRVLVADDDPVYRNLLQELLEQWGFEVLLANDGVEAWEVFQRADTPELLLLDWMMPRMDGFELARKIRNECNEKEYTRTYILLITNSRQRENISRVIVCEADDYLLKPFEPMDLKIHLRCATRVISLQNELEEFKAAGSRHIISTNSNWP